MHIWSCEHEGYNGRPSKYPDAGRHGYSAVCVTEPQVCVGMDGGQVAVYTDAAHEGNADVDVGEEDCTRQATRHLSEGPVIATEVVVNAEGENAQENGVSHSETDDINSRGGLVLCFEDEDIESAQIPQQTKHHHKDVGDGEEVELEIGSPLTVA